MVEGIRQVEQVGTGGHELSQGEVMNRVTLSKSML